MKGNQERIERDGENLRSSWLKSGTTIEQAFQQCKDMLAYGFANTIVEWDEEIFDWQRAYAYAFKGLRHGQ